MQIAKCLGQFWQKIWRKINLQHAESKSDTSMNLQKVENTKQITSIRAIHSPIHVGMVLILGHRDKFNQDTSQ